jgi:acyl-CoA synthetase (NDP forming)
MAPAGVEMIVGVVHDPHFGPVVACGAGGALVEVLGDVCVRLTPLGKTDASEMIRDLKSYRLLTGFRGKPAADVRALEDAVLRIATLVDDLREIAEMDVNPIIVHETGATVVDVRVRVDVPVPSRPLGARS